MPLDHHVTLGRSGLRVSPLCLGAMTFGEDWGWGSSPAESARIIDAYIDRGGNFIDTANVYTKGHSEAILGEHLAASPARRRKVVLATKFYGTLYPGEPNNGGASRASIMRNCDESLRRLRTDCIDLYWLHCHDKLTPIEETMQALDDLVRSGKVRYIGFSDTPAWKCAQAQTMAQLRGWAPLIALQIEYSLLERTVEGELVPMAREMGLGITPWSPLKSGALSGKYTREDMSGGDAARQAWASRSLDERAFKIIDVLRQVAAEVGTSPARVALSWLAGRPGVSSIILGARTLAQLEDNLGALDVSLSPSQRAALDKVSQPQLNFPAAFLERAGVFGYGGSTVDGVSYPQNPLAPKGDGDRFLSITATHMDAIVIGSGPNGLVAAAYLARAGMKVLVLEAKQALGGACRSEELTLPGFVHDVGAGFFPFGPVSPALSPLELEGCGVRWRHAPFDSAHPSLDGTCPALSRDIDAAAATMGRDGDVWRELVRWHKKTREPMLEALLSPLPAIGPGLDFGLDGAFTLASHAVLSARSFGARRFMLPQNHRIVPSLCLHADVGPDDPAGAAIGLVLALLASSSGFCVPEGGAGQITRAIAQRFEDAGGSILLGNRVERVMVRGGRAVGVITDEGEEIEARRAIVADVGAPALYLRMLGEEHVPSRVRGAMRRFPQGWGTFKVDWALSGPIPWASEAARRSAVVHTGDDVDDLARFTAEVRAGRIPDKPYLVVGQQTLCDETRAPAGQASIYCYTHAPSRVAGGWQAARERFADSIEERIEGLAPGFRALVRGRAIHTPDDLEAMNENLVGGDLGGGTAAITHQLFFRPVFPYFRYRTPVPGLYLCSSYAHPGTGVHGACGRNAALAVLDDV